MLQITTGRFWGYADRYKSEHATDVFSVALLTESVDLPPGKLEQVSVEDGSRSAVFSYQSGLPVPAGGARAGVMVATSGREIEEQFVALLTVSSGRLWDLEKEQITQLTGAVDNPLPRLVEPGTLCSNETAIFFRQVLALTRTQYKAVVSASIALHHAVRASMISYDAAFAMAVFALESLIPHEVEGYNWSHFPEPTKRKLDEVLNSSGELGDAVREVLLADGNFKHQARFIKFVSEHLDRAFFRSGNGFRRSDLKQLLFNAYSGRSGFVHALTSVEKPVVESYAGRVVTWKGANPHLTLQGVFLLAFEVIRCVVHRGLHLENEENVAWQTELPDVITVPMAHEYWLWRPEAFQGNEMRERFSDVVEHLTFVCIGATAKLVDLRGGIGAAISRFEQLPIVQRRLVLSMAVLWSRIAPNYAIPGVEALFEKHKEWFNTPSIESLVLHVWGVCSLSWDTDLSAETWRMYMENRYRAKTIKLPHQVESAIRGTIANDYLGHGKVQLFASWCEEIADDEGARPTVISHIEEALSSNSPLDITLLLGIRRETAEENRDCP
jgi:hypothetical protein